MERFLSEVRSALARGVLILTVSLLLIAPTAGPAVSKRPTPRIAITHAPSLPPGEFPLGEISGTASGVNEQNVKIILFSHGDLWYVQPWANNTNTIIYKGRWKNITHGGWEYAAVLCRSSYKPPATAISLPRVGGDILAVARYVPGR